MSQKQRRKLLQTFCQNLARLPWQSTKGQSDGAEIFEEPLTRTKDHEKVTPIQDNPVLLSSWAMKEG